MFGATTVLHATASTGNLHTNHHTHKKEQSRFDTSNESDVYDLADDYGEEAALALGWILQQLETHGYARARVNALSAFDRILGGLCWLLQRLVKREDAEHGRVQWNLLFQSHRKMKPRLGLAQEVLKRIEQLPYVCPVPIQPHQLLLQDFGDIGTVKKLVKWLLQLHKDACGHLQAIRDHRAYLDVVHGEIPNKWQAPTTLKHEVLHLHQVYGPQRRYQLATKRTGHVESEDALIQRCLLEYGERIGAVACFSASSESAKEDTADTLASVSIDPGDVKKQLMLQLATQAASSSRDKSDSKPRTGTSVKIGKQAAEFEAQYQQAERQALEEQQQMLVLQKEREAQLLQDMVSVPNVECDQDHKMANDPSKIHSVVHNATLHALRQEIQTVQLKLQKYERQLQALELEQQHLETKKLEIEAAQATSDQCLAQVEFELQQLEIKEASNHNQASAFDLMTLKVLVQRNETLKRQKAAFKLKCREELGQLQARIDQLRQQAAKDAAKQDEETLRLNEIEQMHSQMATKHKEMQRTLAHQTRAMCKLSKQIDEVPTRIELIQYEKRFAELYDEVALTLDETRKYYCVYNTLKTTQSFLDKEISLLQSIYENLEIAMGSKAATDAFFGQIDAIMEHVHQTIDKQQDHRQRQQAKVETLDSKYQLLLEKERMYVNAIREFQKECEKNERLALQVTKSKQQQKTTIRV